MLSAAEVVGLKLNPVLPVPKDHLGAVAPNEKAGVAVEEAAVKGFDSVELGDCFTSSFDELPTLVGLSSLGSPFDGESLDSSFDEGVLDSFDEGAVDSAADWPSCSFFKCFS